MKARIGKIVRVTDVVQESGLNQQIWIDSRKEADPLGRASHRSDVRPPSRKCLREKRLCKNSGVSRRGHVARLRSTDLLPQS
jgi:hypothetical protein